jgi:hypothetical protein
MADEEIGIERQRQELVELPEFETYSCFTRIDRANQGVIYSKDIVEFMASLGKGGPTLSEFEVNYLIKYFDSSFSGCLSYQDFVSICLPCCDPELRATVTQRRDAARTNINESLPGDVEGALATLFEMEILYHLRLEQLKLEMRAIPDFKESRLFKMIQ